MPVLPRLGGEHTTPPEERRQPTGVGFGGGRGLEEFDELYVEGERLTGEAMVRVQG